MELLRYSDGALVAVEEVTSDADYNMGVDPVQVLAKFTDVAAEVRSRIDELGNQLKKSTSCPAEVTIEFGVELEAGAGLPVIAKGSANCHLTVTATWNLEKR